MWLVAQCGWGTTCSVDASVATGWNSHVAFTASAGVAFLPTNLQAGSNSVHTERIRLS